jgi:hypothetical protein
MERRPMINPDDGQKALKEAVDILTTLGHKRLADELLGVALLLRRQTIFCDEKTEESRLEERAPMPRPKPRLRVINGDKCWDVV